MSLLGTSSILMCPTNQMFVCIKILIFSFSVQTTMCAMTAFDPSVPASDVVQRSDRSMRDGTVTTVIKYNVVVQKQTAAQVWLQQWTRPAKADLGTMTGLDAKTARAHSADISPRKSWDQSKTNICTERFCSARLALLRHIRCYSNSVSD